MDFELVKGRKGKGTTIQTSEGDFDPSRYNTVSRGIGRCPCCENIIEDNEVVSQGGKVGLGHQLYAIAFRKGKTSLDFRIPTETDHKAVLEAEEYLRSNLDRWQDSDVIPSVQVPYGHLSAERSSMIQKGLDRWDKLFNHRQILTLVTYVEILREVKKKLRLEYESERVEAIATYSSSHS